MISQAMMIWGNDENSDQATPSGLVLRLISQNVVDGKIQQQQSTNAQQVTSSNLAAAPQEMARLRAEYEEIISYAKDLLQI